MTPRIVKLISEIDEFKGFWKGMERISSESLSTLRILSTVPTVRLILLIFDYQTYSSFRRYSRIRLRRAKSVDVNSKKCLQSGHSIT